MLETGAQFVEVDVHSDRGNASTDAVCQKMSSDLYRIDDQPVTLPVTVDDASMMMNMFLVDAAQAQKMIADSGFKVICPLPGKALLQLLAVDYRQNDLGNYNEAAIMFPVYSPGNKPFPFIGNFWRLLRSKQENFVYRMPVDQPFTTHAGRFIWGFPKWQARVEFEMGEASSQARFYDEEQLVFAIQAPSGKSAAMPRQDIASLAVRGGKAYRTIGSTEGRGASIALGGQLPEIGNQHPLALELKALGLPKKPVLSVSAKQVNMRFAAPEVTDIGDAF